MPVATKETATGQRPEYRVRPTPKQDEFLFSPAKYAAFVGGVGSGKTFAGCIKAILHCRPGQDGMIVAPTYTMLRDVVQRTFLDLLIAAHIPYEHQKAQEIVTVNGSRVLFRSADDPDKLRGPNLNWVYVDEAALCSEALWRVLLGRLRMGAPSAWITTTPAGFNWVYRYWVERTDPNYGVVISSTSDNTYLPAEYYQDLKDTYTGDFAAQELEGKFVAWEGLVYSGFARGLHVVKPFAIPESWATVRSIDFGFTNPFVCIWGRVDPDGRLYIVDEHYKRKTLIGDHAEAIKARGNHCLWTVADHDAQDAAELRAHGVGTRNAQKEVMRGIQKVAARLTPAGDGKPRIYFFDSCKETVKEIEVYRWQDPKEERNEKEEPLKQSDHAMDALRYMVMELDNRRVYAAA